MINTISSMTEQIGQYRRHYLRWLSILCLVATLPFLVLHFFVWNLYVAGVACALYIPVCGFVIWGSYGYGWRLDLFVRFFIFASVALMLVTISVQRPDVVVDPWILGCPVLAFALCKRQEAGLWSTFSLLGLLIVRQIAQHPAPLASLVALALALVTISAGLYRYSMHVDNIERLMVEFGNMDSLTNTLNRRSFHEVLQTEFRRNLRQQISMTAIMVDADHFKLYNDHYGHVDGDRVLVNIAETLKQSARRPGDFVFRYGGEEFCILCSGLDARQAAAFTETLRANVEALALQHQASPTRTINVSIGYRHADSLDSLAPLTPEKLVEDADKALYRAKANGRNRVESYSALQLTDVAHRASVGAGGHRSVGQQGL